MNINLITNIIAVIVLCGVAIIYVIKYPYIGAVELIVGFIIALSNYFIGKKDGK